MMARGGGIGGCWASFSPSWFLEPRPLSSCSTLSPLVSSLLLALSHVADLTAVPLPTTGEPSRASQTAPTALCTTLSTVHTLYIPAHPPIYIPCRHSSRHGS